MKYFICLFVVVSLFTNGAKGQEDFKKNHLQIGRSGFYFGDRPFKIGRSGVGFTNHGIRVYTYLPYIGYTRRFKNNFGIRLSMEQFEAAYCKKDVPCRPEVNEIFFRDFYQVQISGVRYFSLSDKVKILAAFTGGYRFKGSQSLIEIYIDHGTWEEGFGRTDKIQGFGGGIESEILISPYKKFTLAIRGELLHFFNEPNRQYGLGAALGYEF